MTTQFTDVPLKYEEPRIDEVRRELLLGMRGLTNSVRRLHRCWAVVWWLTWMLWATTAFMLADMIFQSSETGLRMLASAVWLSINAGCGWWLVVPAWRFSPANTELAQHIEVAESCPSLSAAVELAATAKDEWRFGAPEFRNAFLVNWRMQQPQLNWTAWPNRRKLGVAGCIFILTLISFILIVSVWSAASLLALTRLALPWSTAQWPRDNYLRILHVPEIVMRGSDLEIEVVDDSGPLPNQIDLLVRKPSASNPSESTIEQYPLRILRTLAVTTIPNIDQAIDIRAVGGDDLQMNWRRINVGTAPEMLEPNFYVQPPDYVAASVKSLVGTQVEVLEGSQVRFTAKFAEEVRSVTVVPVFKVSTKENAPTNTSAVERLNQDESNNSLDGSLDNSVAWSVTLSPSGKQLTLHGPDGSSLVAKNSLQWQLVITTIEGLEVVHPATWSMKVSRDVPPVVALQPLDSPLVSTQSCVRLKGQATDDIALERLSVGWERQGIQPVETGTIPLWSDAKSPDANSQGNSSESAASLKVADDRRSLDLDFSWELARSLSMVPDQKYQVWLEARDIRGQTSRSQSQTIEVRLPQDVVAQLQTEQSKIFAQLQQLVELQRRNLQLAERTHAAVRQSNSIRPEDVDTLAGMAQLQSSIQQGLAAESSSVLAEIDGLLARASSHQLDETELTQQLSQLRDRTNSIASQSISAAAQASKEVASQARSAKGDPQSKTDTVANSTQQLAEQFRKGAQDLESLTEMLAHSESVHDMQRDLHQVLERQRELKSELNQLELSQTANSSASELEASKAGLRSDQQGLARTLDEVLSNAKSLIDQSLDDAPELQSSLEAVRQEVVDQQLSQAMRDAADLINQDQFADAAMLQQRVVDSLHQSLRQMSPTARGSLDDLLADAKRTGHKLESLANEQRQLSAQMQSAGLSTNDRATIGEHQSELARQTERVTQQLERQGNHTDAELANSAVDAQQRANQAVQEGNMESAIKSAEVAAQRLEQAAKSNAGKAEQLAQELAQQQMFQLKAALNQIVPQQADIVRDLEKLPVAESTSDSQTSAIEAERRADRSQILIIQQQAVRQMVAQVRDQSQQLASFDWALAQADNDMQRSVAAMQRNRVRPEALRSASSALRKLQVAASAIAEQQPDLLNSPDSQSQQEPDEQSPNGHDREWIPPLASLKLLRGMQQDVNQETKQLDEDRSLLDSIENAARLAELSAQQRSISKQLLELLEQIRQQRTAESVQ